MKKGDWQKFGVIFLVATAFVFGWAARGMVM